MLETILLALAGIGLLAIIFGRHKMIRDTGGDLPMLWMIALRFIPFSDLVYLVRHFRQARTGGIIAIVGMWLMVPFAGNQLWQRQNQMKEFVDGQKEQFAKRMQQAMGHEEEDAAPGTASPETQARKILGKEKLVAQLNARLSWWHQQLQNRKAALDPKNDTAVREFNADAAAYAGLNEIAKEKNQELAALRSVAKR